MAYLVSPCPIPSTQPSLARGEEVARASALWLRRIDREAARRQGPPSPEQAAMTARVLENERILTGRTTRIR